MIPAAATAVTITVAGTHPTLPGPDQIVACPNYQGLEKYGTLAGCAHFAGDNPHATAMTEARRERSVLVRSWRRELLGGSGDTATAMEPVRQRVI
jgi:hypothetical protein